MQVDTLFLTIHPLPATPILSITPNTSCSESNGIITVTSPVGGYLYDLDGGGFQSSNTFANLNAGEHTVSVRDISHGCVSTTAALVTTVGSTLAVEASGTSPCNGGDVELFAETQSGGVTYLWSGPDNFTSTLQNPVINHALPANAGVYTVVVTETATGCVSSSSVTVTVNPTYYFPEHVQVAQGDLPYHWQGRDLYNNATIYDSLQTVAGCDSVLFLKLTVVPFNVVEETPMLLCFGDTVNWHGHLISEPGTYRDTAFAANSIYIVRVIVNSIYYFSENVSYPQGSLPYIWHGHELGGDTTVYDSLQTVVGCDSVLVLNLTIIPFDTIEETPIVLCLGDTANWRGHLLSEPGVYCDTAFSQNTIYMVTVMVNPTYFIQDNLSVPEGSLPYVWRGRQFYGSATAYDSLTTRAGCDSVYSLNLTVIPFNVVEDATISLCPGETEIWHGHLLSGPDIYRDTAFSENNIYVVTVIVNPTYYFPEDLSYPQGSLPFNWHGYLLNGDTVLYDSLLTNAGCDSVYYLNFTVIPFNYVEENPIEICAGQTVSWRGHLLSEEGVYNDTVFAENIIYMVTVTINPIYFITETATVPEGSLPYNWHGRQFYGGATAYDSLTTTAGCDSVYYLNLMVIPFNVIEDATISLCPGETINWHGQLLSGPGTYTDTVFAENNIYVVTVTVNPLPVVAVSGDALIMIGHDATLTAMGAGSYLWSTGVTTPVVTVSPQETTIYTVTGTNTFGCSDTASFEVVVINDCFLPLQNGEESVHCVSQAVPPQLPEVIACGDTIPLVAGENTGDIESGCGDSVFVYHYTVRDTQYTWTYTYHVSPDEMPLLNNSSINISCLSDTVKPTPPLMVNNCSDTIVPTALPVEVEVTGCRGVVRYIWKYEDCAGHVQNWTYSYIIRDNIAPTFSQPGDVAVCRNANGAYDADTSITGLPVSLDDNCADTEDLSVTYNDLFVDNQTMADTLFRTWVVTDPCGNVARAVQKIIVYDTYHTEIHEGICVRDLPYTFNVGGRDTIISVVSSYNSTFNFPLASQNGCDSLVTLHLTVDTVAEIQEQLSICENELPYHFTYGQIDTTFEEGTPAFSTCRFQMPAQGGCESVLVLALTITPSYNVDITQTACDMYIWHNTPYRESGRYEWYGQTVNGCDSVETLWLTIRKSSMSVQDSTVCDNDLPIVWNGVTFYEAGTGSAILAGANAVHCDSVVLMTLHVNRTDTTVLYDTIVQNQLPYHFTNGLVDTTFGINIPQESVSIFHFASNNGCDSTVSLNLTVLLNPNAEADSTVCENDLPLVWNDVRFTGAGTDTVVLTAFNGVDSVLIMHVHVNQNTSATLYDTIVENQLPYHYANGQIDTTFAAGTAQSSTSRFLLQNVNGCDSTVTLCLTINMNVTAQADSTICENDLPLQWNGITFSGAGTDTVALAASNGADSLLVMHVYVNHNTSAALYDTIVENQLPYHYTNGQIDTVFAVGTPHFTTSRFMLSNANGCDSVVILELTVILNVSVELDSAVCPSALPLIWNGVEFSDAGTDTVVVPASAGSDSVIVMNLAILPAQLTNLHDEVCASDFPYHFINGQIDTVITSVVPHHAVFNFLFSTQDGCDSVVSLDLSVLDTSLSVVPLSDFCDNMSTTLSALSSMENFVWSTGETSQDIEVTAPGVYSVTASTGDCQSMSAYVVDVCELVLYLPNAISPGKLDGHNDCFSLPERCIGLIDEFEITILNRWGEVVFHSNDKNFKWYGDYKGSVVRQNVYNYVIYYTELDDKKGRHHLKGALIVL